MQIQNTWLMLSLESRAGAGVRGVDKKVEKALCSLIFLKRSRQDVVCLGCSTAQEKGRSWGEWVRRRGSGVREREHAAFSYRLLPTIAESGTLYIRVELYALSLSVGVMDASSRKSGLSYTSNKPINWLNVIIYCLDGTGCHVTKWWWWKSVFHFSAVVKNPPNNLWIIAAVLAPIAVVTLIIIIITAVLCRKNKNDFKADAIGNLNPRAKVSVFLFHSVCLSVSLAAAVFDDHTSSVLIIKPLFQSYQMW